MTSENNQSRRAFLAAGLGGLAALTGCNTTYKPGSQTLSKEAMNYWAKRASAEVNPSEIENKTTRYGNSANLAERFNGQLPRVNLTFYTQDGKSTLNTNAPINTSENTISLQYLLDSTPSNPQEAMALTLGRDSRDMVFQPTYQFTRDSGLFSIHNLSNDDNSGVLVEAKKVTSVTPRLKGKKAYDVFISPASESTLSQDTYDFKTLTDATRDSIIAGAIAGPIAAAIPAVYYTINSAGSFFEAQNKLPEGMSLSRVRNIRNGVDSQVANIAGILDSAKSLGARALTLAHNDSGAVYVTSATPDFVEIDKATGTARLRMTEYGANYLMSSMAVIGTAAAMAGVASHIPRDTNTKTRKSNNDRDFGGGRTSQNPGGTEPTGTGGSSSGGRGGSSTGNPGGR